LLDESPSSGLFFCPAEENKTNNKQNPDIWQEGENSGVL